MADRKHNVGDRFNRWELLAILPANGTNSMWRVMCDCGVRRDTYASNITRGKSRSCGSCGAKERERRYREERDG